MAENTKIEWAHDTANLWWGCVKIGSNPGCDNCYAAAMDRRIGGDHWGARKPRRAIKSVWSNLRRWQRLAEESGETRRVFVGSMMDIFERAQPLVDHKGNELPGTTEDLRQRFFEEVVPASSNLLFLLLTKRPSNISRMVPEEWLETPPPNVMYGCSVVDQETADRDIPKLLQVPGQRFLSCEPLLGPIDLEPWLSPVDIHESHGVLGLESEIDWVIVGGESGAGARPMSLSWVRDIRDQCQAADVPVLIKQLGARPYLERREGLFAYHSVSNGSYEDGPFYAPQIKDAKGGDMSEWPEDLRIRQFPEVNHEPVN